MVKARRSLTTIVGTCLAAVAAGSLVLFSIFAQEATLGDSTDDSGVQVATPDGSAPVISLPGSSNAGGDDGTQNESPDGSDEPLTGPLALLLEPITPGELVAQLDSPDGDSTGSTSTPPSAGPTAPGPDDDAVAVVSERIERRLRVTLDPDARDVRAGLRALRSQGGGRPSPGDGGNEAPGKSDGAGKGKDKDKPGRGHSAGKKPNKDDKTGRGHSAGDKSNKGGKGHARTKGRAAKPNKEKKSKAPKPAHSNGGGHQKTSSTAPTRSKPQKSRAPSHSTGPPAQSKSKAPKPATSKAKSPPGHAAGGPPGQSKEKKKK